MAAATPGVKVAAALLFCIATAAMAAAEEVVTVPTREGVSVSYLLVREPSATPKVVVVSFIGSLGAANFAKRSAAGPLKFGPTVNFLLRARAQFADADFADVFVDAPSDQLPEGMHDEFRLGPQHAQDIRAVVADVRKRYPGAKIFLMGTSRGTISAAALGASLADVVAGVVLSSTVTNRDKAGPALSGFDFGTIPVPVLLVHHRQDGCYTSPYAGAERLAKRYPL
ncbi:MAG: alpha/beta hydrolase, partial [Casimicrobiaceae bacterium]